MERPSISDEVRRGVVGEENGVVVRHMPSRAKHGAGQIGSSTSVILYGDVIGGDGGYNGDVARGVWFIANGDDFIEYKGVAVGWIEDGTRAGGDGTVGEDIRNGSFEFSASGILSHAVP